MRLEWMRCFNEVVKSGSITKAAQNLYIPQPAVTKTIHALESELGETLLIRSSTGVQLTEQGKIFEQFAWRVLKEYERYQSEKNACKELASAYSGTIELAISPLLLQTYYQPITQHVRQHFPQINLCFVEADLDAAAKLISQNARTLGLILSANITDQQLDAPIIIEELCTSHVVICTAKDSKYADLETIDSASIPAEKLISIEVAKQSSLLPEGAFNSYTTNLAVIRQKLMTDDEVCVSLPQMIADKQFATSGIIQLHTQEERISSVGFFYSRDALEQSLYDPAFLKRFAQELKTAVLA